MLGIFTAGEEEPERARERAPRVGAVARVGRVEEWRAPLVVACLVYKHGMKTKRRRNQKTEVCRDLWNVTGVGEGA